LDTFNAGNGKAPAEQRISGTSINGSFVVVSAAIESFYIEYDSGTDSITTTQINPRVRDFDWQGDTSGYLENISRSLVSDERRYDTYNTGWLDKDDNGGDVLFGSDEGIVTREGFWPKLTHPWYIARPLNSKFFKGNWKKAYAGNTLIGNGRFILDLYNKDRNTAASMSGIATEVELARFQTVAGFAGRVWFSGLSSRKNGSRVFFSSVVENLNDIGNFYQNADPTSEEESDLIDSDGGVINIPNASKITALFEMGSSLLVFAENGVWEIKGIDDVFKAGAFAVSRIADADGITNAATLVNAEGVPFWWGKTGIFSISANPDITSTSGRQGVNISLSTIQTFWEDIPGDQRNEAVGEYDAINNRVFWLYGEDASVQFKYNRVLILDVSLEAFIPWQFGDEGASTPEANLHSRTWVSGVPAAQVVDTDAGSGIWTINRGSVSLITGTDSALAGVPVASLKSIDTDGTIVETETGKMGVYIDLETEGYRTDFGYNIRKAGLQGGTIGQDTFRWRLFQADGGGVASAADQQASFMPPDATNIVEVYDTGFQTFAGPASTLNHTMTGKYISFVQEGGGPNEGDTQIGPFDLFITGNTSGYVTGMSFFSGRGGSTQLNDVVSNSGADDVVSNSGVDDVVSSKFIVTETGTTEMKFLTRDDSTGSLTFSGISNTGFLDWGTQDYSSYAEAAYDFEEDLTTNKHGIYTTVYFNLTETGFDPDLVTALNPSSCIMKAFWDLRETENSSQEVYRFRIPVTANPLDLTEFNYPYSSVVSRNRIRGRGRNLKLRFESSTGKDFQLQGYEVVNAKNQGL
jgi:hypothetical protein